MADQAAIDSIRKLHLADEATDLGITDEVIGSWVDSGLSQTKILAGWPAIAAKTVGIEDVSESGSSRTIRLHDRAIALITDWQARADAEDQQSGTLPAKQHSRLYTGIRV